LDRLQPLGNRLSVEKGHRRAGGPTASMTRETKNAKRKLDPDWDELRLWRGEPGPNVADEFSEK